MPAMDTFWLDLRFAARTLLRNPGFSAVAVFTLALGIAATGTVVTVAAAVLLHDLPYPDPDRLLLLQSYRQEQGARETFFTSYPDYRDWKAKLTSFTALGVHSNPTALNLLTTGDPERVNSELVDSAYFDLLGVRPVVGRAFTKAEDAKPGEPRSAVISHALWRRRFGGDPAAVGKVLVLNGDGYVVVGVMPARFRGLSDEADLWLPLTMAKEVLGSARFLERRGVRWLTALGRLRPGVSAERAQREMDAMDAALARQFPDTDENIVVQVETLRQSLFGDLRFPLLTLIGASVFVLLIGWTTVANLLLARATARQPEIAMRTALGATRGRLLLQLLVESLVLSGASCLAGLLLSAWATRPLVVLAGVKFQSFVDLGLDPAVAGALAVLSLVCGVTFGLAPAWVGVRRSSEALRQGSSSTGVAHYRFQSWLVVAEMSLALFLLVGAGLMIRGFQQARRASVGFDSKGLLTVRVELKGKRYAEASTMVQLARQYRDRLRAVPGVRSVSLAAPIVPTDGWFASSFVIEDLLPKTKDGTVMLVFHHVTPGYFQDLRMPLEEGRDFVEADDDKSQPVTVISEAMRRKYWPHESPLGRRIKFGKRDAEAPWLTVVGVVGDVDEQALQELEWPGADIYLDAFQLPSRVVPVYNFLIRGRGVAPLSLVTPVARELRAIAPDLPPYDADTIENRLDRFHAKRRYLAVLMGLFAGLALVIAAVGIYGVLSYSVTRRTRELGIRVALGARRQDVAKLVVRQAALLTAAGLAIGLAAALGFDRLFHSLFYGLSPTDLATLVGTPLLLMLVALAAAWVPARRAMRVQPTTALRTE
jgi:putative ABC transport system permease protein